MEADEVKKVLLGAMQGPRFRTLIELALTCPEASTQ